MAPKKSAIIPYRFVNNRLQILLRKWVNADNCSQYISNDGLLTVIKKGVQYLRSEDKYFIQAIRTYGEKQKWTISKINKIRAKLEVSMPSGHKHILSKLRNILKKSGIRKHSKLDFSWKKGLQPFHLNRSDAKSELRKKSW